MSTAIIITICTLLLIAYIFDITASWTKIPPVILLLLLGWVAKEACVFFNIQIPDLNSLLPIFGTIGLILIVLDGSLELEFERSKLKLIRQSFFSALIPIVGLSFLFAYAFYSFGALSFRNCLINAIPLSIISSAIAIPSVKNLSKKNREFVIYESSLSDIFGVLFFNFVTLNNNLDGSALGHFGLQLVIIILVSFIATLALAFLLHKIDHHIKFAPIIILIIIIYEVSKVFHLPALVFILLFGLFLGNLDVLKDIKWISKVKPEILDKEVHKFKEFVIEGAFLIRTMFFIIFGYLMDIQEILNIETLFWAIGITTTIFLFRLIQLKIYKLEIIPLLFIAPRGLITILLFLSIDPMQVIVPANKSMIIQVIILTSVIMMLGLMSSKNNKSLDSF